MLRGINLLAVLEKPKNRPSKWFRSLFAIYDLDDMVHLGLPWWTFDAVEFVESFLEERKDARVFEWGSGASTIWLSKHSSEVVSVEHDPKWSERVGCLIENFSNTTLKAVPPKLSGCIRSNRKGYEDQFFDDYVQSIHEEEGKFDLIVIDGRARESCLTEAAKKLAEGGYILFDDTKRICYQTAIKKSGLRQRRLSGLAVCLPLPDATDLLSHPMSCQ
ncbi:class I SAM-dependent methyltransferase [Kiloniella sp.]|uniref:class I SAM-dependent methyltransferase n=1 Tax=Kiloniella sp. TaxID=1938587 RepID=UPI003B022500